MLIEQTLAAFGTDVKVVVFVAVATILPSTNPLQVKVPVMPVGATAFVADSVILASLLSVPDLPVVELYSVSDCPLGVSATTLLVGCKGRRLEQEP